MGKRKNLLFSTMIEPQLIMKPVLEPGWMESQRTDGWAEGDPFHGQHEVLIYLNWTYGFGVTSVCKCGDNIGRTKTGNHCRHSGHYSPQCDTGGSAKGRITALN